jgi:N-acetylated-alpha-linked acidic dipeptidase
MRPLLRPLLLAAVLVAAPAAAQQMPGYAPQSAAAERALEASAIRRPDPARASEISRALTREAHVAGTEAQARTRDYVIERMKEMGLPTEVRAYDVYLPHATAVRLWRVSPRAAELPVQEPPIPGDPVTHLPQYPPANGYSAPGDVTAPVVFAGYGLIEDYAALDSMGVSVEGKVVVARYGRSFRGIKAREAERHGAAALLLYSDPEDDGYGRGQVYPDGPMRPPLGLQRGSVYNGDGDPWTPGYASVPGAPHAPLEEAAIPRIPVAAIGYGNARELLEGLHGPEVPEEWQGALPFRYRVGPGPVMARLRVETDAPAGASKRIWDTFGVVRGSELPEQVIVIGGHRDAWGAGAADNVSGTVSVLEAARAVAEELKAGHRPKRTIVFATWDAEEWGLFGSTEYVEDDSLRLRRGGVAYLNQDMVAFGASFSAGGSPSLRALLRNVASAVPDPTGGSVYEAWRRRAGAKEGEEPEMGDPGGGSDFAGFYNHLGIPILEWGFSGPAGIYHSAYDDYEWMSRYGDPGFERHATAARLGAAIALRLANADILPYDYVEFARTMQRYLPALDSASAGRGWSLSSGPLRDAIARMEAAALAFSRRRDAVLARGVPPLETRRRADEALLTVERALTRPTGLRGRPWYRNLIYVADENNGYATMVFPSVNEAVRAGDEARAEAELRDLASRFEAAAAALDAATAALR